jgi:membrane fusion protein, multidrug efflux system
MIKSSNYRFAHKRSIICSATDIDRISEKNISGFLNIPDKKVNRYQIKNSLMKYMLLIPFILVLYSSCGDKKDPETKAPEAAPKYTLVAVQRASIGQQLKLPGQLAAYQEVSIFPKENGYVKTVLVDIGSAVKKGQVLMTLEAPELQQAVVQAKERFARSKSDYTLDRENYERLQEASMTPGAISPLDLATAKSKTEADSALANAARSNWEMQQTMMDYLIVTAPFSGVITQRNVSPGALVSAEAKDSKPMLELKEVDHLRLQIDIPESAAADLKTNDSVSFFLTAFPGEERRGRISRISMNINMQFRSERIELDVYNPAGLLAPGMYADVLFDSKGIPNSLAVPKSAVVTSTERKYVVAVRNGKTVKVDVHTGNENASMIEIIGEVKPGEQVIVGATDEIKEGTPVD